MKRIVKSAAPACLSNARQKGWNWGEFVNKDHEGYLQCRELASSDQKNMCGYTEMPLGGKGLQLHLDHYKKKSIYPALTFEWENLVFAVKDNRFGADFKDKVVDGKNAATVYASILNPVLDEAQDCFYYDTGGRVYPIKSMTEGQRNKAQETIRVFNLNETELVSRRRTMISQLSAFTDVSEADIRSLFSEYGFATVLEQEMRLRDR